MRVSALFFDKDARYPCLLSPCKVWDDALSQAVSGPELKVYCYWESKKVSTLLALHISSGGQVPDLRLLPFDRKKDPSAFEKFAEEHQHCLDNRKAIVVKINEHRELLFAPVFSVEDDGTKCPVFWGYVLNFGVASAVSLMLDNSRMAVILDLDETLLVANSMSTLDSKIEVARKTRRVKAAELRELLSQGVTADSEEAARLRGAEASAAQEEELLASDLEVLRQFANTSSITINGITHRARLEVAVLEDGTQVKRPVIRLDKPNPVILTRIRPDQRETSMILRPRPFWEELRAVLAGDAETDPSGKPKLRFDVYVCTAAERQYALEVWRLLDTRTSIIPTSERSKRIINVPGGRKKQLLKSLGVAESAGNPRLEWSELQDDDPPVPLAVVLDDRLDVWEAATQSCILQVVPWYWYRDEAARLVSGPGTPADRLALASENEIKRMRDAVLQLRAELFYDINERLRKLADHLVTVGAPEEEQRRNPGALLPGLKTVAGILRAAANRVYQMPTLASIAAQFRPNNAAATPPPEMEPPAILPPPTSSFGGFPPVAGLPPPTSMVVGPPTGGTGGPGPMQLPLAPAGAGPEGVTGAQNGFNPAAAAPPAQQGLGQGQGSAAPPAVISLKPVDPRAARRAAAAAQRGGSAMPRPTGGIVLQPPAPGLGPQPITAFGALSSLGPPPAPQPAPEPPKRRMAAGALDPSKWSIEALEDRAGAPAQQQQQQAPIAEPSSGAAVSGAGSGVAGVPANDPRLPNHGESVPGQVPGPPRPEAGSGVSLDRGREQSNGSAHPGLQCAGHATAQPADSAAAGPGPRSLTSQAQEDARAAKVSAAPDAVVGQRQQQPQQQAAPSETIPSSGSAGTGGAGAGGPRKPSHSDELVRMLISQISTFEPSVRASIEEWLQEPETGVPKVVALLRQSSGQAGQQAKPPQHGQGPHASSNGQTSGAGAEATKPQPQAQTQQQVGQPSGQRHPTPPLQQAMQQQQPAATLHPPPQQQQQQQQQQEEQQPGQQLPLQPKHPASQQQGPPHHRQPSPQHHSQPGLPPAAAAQAQAQSQYPPPPPLHQQQQPQQQQPQQQQLSAPQPSGNGGPQHQAPQPQQQQQLPPAPHQPRPPPGAPPSRPPPHPPPVRGQTPPLPGHRAAPGQPPGQPGAQAQGPPPQGGAGPQPQGPPGHPQPPPHQQQQGPPQPQQQPGQQQQLQPLQLQVMIAPDGRVMLQPPPGMQGPAASAGPSPGQGPQGPGVPMGPGQMAPACFPGSMLPQGPGMPQQGPGMPQQGPGMPQQGPGMPQQGPGMPQQGPGMTPQGPGMTQQVPNMPQQGPGMPPQQASQQAVMQMPVPLPGGGLTGAPMGGGGGMAMSGADMIMQMMNLEIAAASGLMGPGMGPGMGVPGQGPQGAGLQPMMGMGIGMVGPGGGPMQQQPQQMAMAAPMMLVAQGPGGAMPPMPMQMQPGGPPMQMPMQMNMNMQMTGGPQQPQQQQGPMGMGMTMGMQPQQPPQQQQQQMGPHMGPHGVMGMPPQGAPMGAPFGGPQMLQPGQQPGQMQQPGMQQAQGMPHHGMMQFPGVQPPQQSFMGGQGQGMMPPPQQQQAMGQAIMSGGPMLHHAGMKRPPSPSSEAPGEPPAKAPRQGGGPHDNGAPGSGLPGGLPPWHIAAQQQQGGGNAPAPPGPPPGPPQDGAGGDAAGGMMLFENPVTKLNDVAQRNKVVLMFRESKGGDGGGSGWTIVVNYGGKDIGRGHAATKKDAKRMASMSALKMLGVSLGVGPPASHHASVPQQQQQQQSAHPYTQSQQGAEASSSGFIGPASAPPGPVNAAQQEGGGLAAGTTIGAGGHPANDATMYRLMNMYGKDNLVFNMVKDEGERPNRHVAMDLSIRGTQHRVRGEGNNRRAARLDAACAMLAHLGVPPLVHVSTGADYSGGAAAQQQQQRSGSSAAYGTRVGGGQDSDSDGDAGPLGNGARAQHQPHHQQHHHQHQQRAQQLHHKQPGGKRSSSRSPRPDEDTDDDDAGDEDYDLLAGASYFARGARPGGQSSKRGKSSLSEDGGKGGSKAYVADFITLIAEELDDGLGGGGGSGSAASRTGAGRGVAGSKKAPGRGAGAGAQARQAQPGQQTKAGGDSDSEEEEGELPSEPE